MAGRFVVMGDGDEGYRFRIEAEDGLLMATSLATTRMRHWFTECQGPEWNLRG